MKVKIFWKELTDFKPVHVDATGDIYRYGDKYIRVIHPSRVNFVRGLFESGCINELMEKGLLVETRISNYFLENEEELILEHKAINSKIMPGQWSFDMIKDSAILICKTNEVLNKYGYELNDCHIGNVCFDGITPVLVDFGSIDNYNRNWKWLRAGFFDNYLYPLKMMNRGFEKLASVILYSAQLGRFDFKNMKHIYYGIAGHSITDYLFRLKRRVYMLCSVEEQKQIERCKQKLRQLQYRPSSECIWGGVSG